MGVLDRDSFEYGQELRALAAAKGCHHIEFLRVMDMLDPGKGSGGGDLAVDISADAYLSAVPAMRADLERLFLDRAFDVERELETNPDTQLTYSGFAKLVAQDMRWGRNFDHALLDDTHKHDQAVEKVARAMIRRLVVNSDRPPPERDEQEADWSVRLFGELPGIREPAS